MPRSTLRDITDRPFNLFREEQDLQSFLAGRDGFLNAGRFLRADPDGGASAGFGYVKPDYMTASLPDNVGQKFAAPAPQNPLEVAAVALVTEPDIANDSSTAASLEVDGARIYSVINSPGDQDWIRVELQAGVTYDIGVYGTLAGPSGIPLFDPLVEVYDSAGNRVAADDSGGPASPYQTDDALAVFTPEASGTYFVNARSWDARDPLGVYGGDPNPATTTGDFVGDYEAFVRVSNLPPDYYEIHYETEDDPATERNEIGLPTLDSSPLHAIDWQTQFDGSSRNPDGAEGPRVTGNEVEAKLGGKNVLTYYFAREGEVFVDNAANPLNLTTTIVAKGFAEWEKSAIELGLDRYENVADLLYHETDDRFAADIVFVTYNGTPGIETPSLAGRMSPPDTASEGQTEYNAGDYRWTPEGLAPGGVFFGTLIHELGHGHGMSHPHDDGGRSSILRGVEEVETFVYTLGDFGLNQGVYTMMSYQDGWQESPYGQPANDLGYGFIGSLMAFDIAVIQDKYGVNEAFATGNDTYVLPDENLAAQFDSDGKMTSEGTSWKSIWDAGGTDQIVYNGSKDANIDLRPATLEYEVGGGGWVSYAFGVHGGFTVANSVTIENASGGSGNDTLTGNDSANRLNGGAGSDTLKGNGGADTLDGGAGTDDLHGGGGNDTYWVETGDSVGELQDEGLDYVWARSSYVLAAASHVEVMGTADWKLTTALNLTGNELANSITGNNGANQLRGGGGNDSLSGLGGNDMLEGGTGIDRLDGGAGNDTYYVDTAETVIDAAGGGFDYVWARSSFVLTGGAEIEILGTTNYRLTNALDLTGNEFNNSITGNNGHNALRGMGGNDNIKGLDGNDVIDGGAGIDQLEGGAGIDTFRFTSASHSARGGADRILDFATGSEEIDLSAIDANTATSADDAFTFIGNAAFSNVAGQLRVETIAGQAHILGDINGDGVADLQIILTNTATIAVGDFIY